MLTSIPYTVELPKPYFVVVAKRWLTYVIPRFNGDDWHLSECLLMLPFDGWNCD
jgi:hypothetical protein